jgi:hypothetical protein
MFPSSRWLLQTPSLPDIFDPHQIPERVLQRRLLSVGATPRTQVLIKWSNMPEELANWENLDDLIRRFPQSPTLEQACSFGRGVLAHLLLPAASLLMKFVGHAKEPECAGPTRAFVDLIGLEAM